MRRSVFLLVAVLTTFICSCVTTLSVRKNLKSEFANVINKRPSGFPNKNVGVLTIYKEDTLNKKSLKQSNVIITGIYTKGENLLKNDAEENNSNNPAILGVALCSAWMNLDTLVLNIGFPFSQRIQYKVFKQKVTANYIAENKIEMFKYSASGRPLNSIMLNLKKEFLQLDDKTFIPGKIIYGKAGFTTPAYFIENDRYIGGFQKQQIEMEILFKVEIAN